MLSLAVLSYHKILVGNQEPVVFGGVGLWDLLQWAFAGLTGNQVANLIVNSTGEFMQDSHGNSINPVGYQNVLYLTIVLYIVALLISLFMVRPLNKDAKKK